MDGSLESLPDLTPIGVVKLTDFQLAVLLALPPIALFFLTPVAVITLRSLPFC